MRSLTQTTMKTKSISNSFFVWSLLSGVLSASALFAQTSLSFDFESPDFSSGSIIGQQGWSAGAFANLLVDPNDSVTVTSESVTSSQAFSGTQSWRYDHGISGSYQFGAGTPFTPNLGYALSDVGDQLYGSIYFKAVTIGDGSYIGLSTGNLAGDDRAEIIGYINNDAGNLSFTLLTLNSARDDYIDVVVADNLDSGWHLLTFSVDRVSENGNTVTASIDGGSSITVEGTLGAYRADSSYAYEESTRLKFAGSISGDGFYFDDLTYGITIVPEPSSIALGLMSGSVLILGCRRRK